METLLIVSHVVHYRDGGQLCAYGPYAREIDVWADLFPRVVIAAPCRDGRAPGDCVAFTRANIEIDPLVEAGGDTLLAKLWLASALPAMVFGLCRSMARADAIHVRCPGGLGLLGVIFGPLFSRRLVAKYAGQWNGFDGEPWTGRLERRLLRSPWWRGPVTVYGEWPGDPEHVVPFFTSMMTRDQVGRARAVAATKAVCRPLRVLYSGVLERRKRVDALIEAVAIATRRGLPVEVVVVGDGAERAVLEDRAAGLHLQRVVRFIGALPFDEALRWYEWAHCLVLPSRHSEGWPKVVAEAMAHGVYCIAVRHGQLAAMFGGCRGRLLEDGSPVEIADALQAAVSDVEEFRAVSARASEWAGAYSLEGLRGALSALLTSRWQTAVGPIGPVETT